MKINNNKSAAAVKSHCCCCSPFSCHPCSGTCGVFKAAAIGCAERERSSHRGQTQRDSRATSASAPPDFAMTQRSPSRGSIAKSLAPTVAASRIFLRRRPRTRGKNQDESASGLRALSEKCCANFGQSVPCKHIVALKFRSFAPPLISLRANVSFLVPCTSPTS